MIEALALEHAIKYTTTSQMRTDLDISEAKEGEEIVDVTAYQSLRGSLQYIAQMTRPDISCITSLLGRRNVKLAKRHREAALRVLSYLFYTKDTTHILQPNDKLIV